MTTFSNYIQTKVKNEMIANGTIARIDAIKVKHHKAAKGLGFENAQAAFNAMGKSFLKIANK
jgi:beta-lactamase superfamily II metal-dependent hydrolase